MRLGATQTAVLLLLGAAFTGRVPPATGADPQISVREGLVSAVLEDAPLDEVLHRLAVATGAELRGAVPADRRVGAQFTDLELRPALERILGDLSFALVYDAEGRLRTIDLRGAPAHRPADAGSHDIRLDLSTWPPNEAVAQAAERLQARALSDRPIPVRGLLRRALDTDVVPWRLLAQTAVANDDRRIRAHAARRAVRALEEGDEKHRALVRLLEGSGDALVADYLRRAAGERAVDLARMAARGARTPAVRQRLRAVVARLEVATPSSR